MSAPCNSLERFVDGELEPADAERFQHHLAECPTCPARMQQLLALELLADAAVNAGEAPAPALKLVSPTDSEPGPAPALRTGTAASPPPPRPWQRRAWKVAVPLALAAGLAALVLVSRGGRSDGQPDVWLAQAPARTLEARLTHRARTVTGRTR